MTENLKEAAKAVPLDLWVCDHYKVLPTEERYKQLTDRQKYLLFQGFIERPQDNDIHRSYWISQRDSFSKKDEENLLKRGYTRDQILKMKNELEKAKAGQHG